MLLGIVNLDVKGLKSTTVNLTHAYEARTPPDYTFHSEMTPCGIFYAMTGPGRSDDVLCVVVIPKAQYQDVGESNIECFANTIVVL